MAERQIQSPFFFFMACVGTDARDEGDGHPLTQRETPKHAVATTLEGDICTGAALSQWMGKERG
jgi:hypothetical protein